MGKRLIDEMNVEKIGNPHLCKLIAHLKKELASETDPLLLVPETAQITPWHHHRDYYDSHNDYHSDYCD